MKNKKMIIAVLIIVGLIGTSLLSGCSKSNTSDKPKSVKFRLAEVHPPDYPTAQADKKFAELVKERSNGRITIDVFPNGQLGDEKAVIEQIQLGAIDFARVSTSPLAEFNKPLGVFALPYIFDNDEHMWRFLEGEYGEKLLAGLESSKMRGLAYYGGGSRNFYTKKPVATVEDLRGLKIRVVQSKVNVDLITTLGASPTPMPYGEVFTGLQTGVIDGAENNSPSYLTANHYQAANHFILDAHQRVPEMIVISKTAWDKLSEDDKKLIKQAALDSVKTQRELWDKFEKESMDKLKASGVIVTEVQDVKPWQQAVKPLMDKYQADFKNELDAIAKARK